MRKQPWFSEKEGGEQRLQILQADTSIANINLRLEQNYQFSKEELVDKAKEILIIVSSRDILLTTKENALEVLQKLESEAQKIGVDLGKEILYYTPTKELRAKITRKIRRKEEK